MEDIGVDGTIILKYILKNKRGRDWIALAEEWQEAISCKSGNEGSD
jgi:hypothetical protein